MLVSGLNARLEAIPKGLRGVLLVVIASAFFATMHNTIRHVTHVEGIHPFEVAFFRNFLGLLVFIPIFLRMGFGVLRTPKIHWHVGRAFLNSAAMLSWFTALSLMPVADATAVSLIGPVFVALLAMFFLKEHVGPVRWLGIALAIVGGLIVVRPGFTEVSSGVWLVLFSAVAVSNSKIVAKMLTRTEGPATIVAYLTLLYRMADISLVEPAMFTRMVWAAIIGYAVFLEFPEFWTWIGAGVIVVGTTLLARRETRSEPRVVSPVSSTVNPTVGD